MPEFKSAPKCGRILAYASDRLIYDAYELKDNTIGLRNKETLSLDGIYELHLFDAVKEFRAIYENGKWNTSVLSEDEEKEEDENHFVFRETQFVQDRFRVNDQQEKLTVSNRFSFDEEGFLRLAGYRLSMERSL